jgi:hypothetical protein
MSDPTDKNHSELFYSAVRESAEKFRYYAARMGVERDQTGWAQIEPTELDSIDAMKMAECLEPLILFMIQECQAPGEWQDRSAGELSKVVYNRIQPILETGLWIPGETGETIIFATAPWMGTTLFKAPAFRAALLEVIVQKIKTADASQPEQSAAKVPSGIRQLENQLSEEPTAADTTSVGESKKVEEAEAPKSRRLSLSVKSPIAARRMEAYLETHGIGQTEFACKVGTTDRTLREFRKTGKIRRNIFDQIVAEMGTTREALLKEE